ncbi:MAG TPA: hypothetical protein VGO50_20055 [Pyrinomonadaceae bacterium]|jgi:hypothetical protein|nr:hypothetical protein [Pyrinomonadaceae bacterium]
MKSSILSFFFFLLLLTGITVFGQKGIDKQTEAIRDNSDSSSKGSRAERSWDFGKDKTKVRPLLSNPYRFASRRDVLIRTITDVLKDKRIIFDEAASRPSDGIIVTQPFMFAKGVVITQQELNRYALVPTSNNSWTRGRYTLTIEVNSIDGSNHNVTVIAKVEGRSESPLGAEWMTFRSSGAAEEEFLTKLVEAVTGVSPDDKPEEIPKDNR